MPTKTSVSASQLEIPKAARFLVLPGGQLTNVVVGRLFDHVLEESHGKEIEREVRQPSATNGYVHSFLCFLLSSPVPFLHDSGLMEQRYGFVLLIERSGHLAIFHRYAKGLDEPVKANTYAVARRRITHLWCRSAKYQQLSTRRMTVARQELRGASYEADDLETALVPATAARSIPRSIRLMTRLHGSVSVTPSSGRIRMSSSRSNLDELCAFIDETLRGIKRTSRSPFLEAFPEPVEFDALPAGVVPTAILIEVSQLQDFLDDPDNPQSVRPAAGARPWKAFQKYLSQLFSLRKDGEEWEVVDPSGTVAGRMKRLTSSYSLTLDAAKDYTIEDKGNSTERLDTWLRTNDAFRVSFSSPDYFYVDGKLSQKAGFEKDVEQVRRFLIAHAPLEDAKSEKGKGYKSKSVHFTDNSIFRIVEKSLANEHPNLWCGDLGDEWADYIGVSSNAVTFYHCKHGDQTSGGSDFQIVVGQALKNIGRIRFHLDDLRKKLEKARDLEFWGSTKIPLLARKKGDWKGLEDDLTDAIADPTTSWRVALVVTALSLAAFDSEAAKKQPRPYFVQLIWLLSAFISTCREHDAQPRIYCRP